MASPSSARATESAATLRARAALARRIAEKTAELGAQYDLKAASRLDLPALQREWKDASAANFVFRSRRQKKVRLALQSCCSAPVPQDIGRDLFILQDLLDLVAEVEQLHPSFKGFERLFDTVGADSAETEAVIGWAEQMDAAIKTLGARLDSAPQILSQTVVLLTDYVDFVGPNGDAGRALSALCESLHATRAGAAALSVSMNFASPNQLLAFIPGGIDALTRAIDRGTENLVKAPTVDPMACRRLRGAKLRHRTPHHRDRGRRSPRSADPSRLRICLRKLGCRRDRQFR
jgi:hypothetical protein